MKEKVLIDLALNYPPVEKPKLIKLAGKERGILSRYYSKKCILTTRLLISNHYFLAIKFSNTLNFGRVSKYCSDANDPTIEI